MKMADAWSLADPIKTDPYDRFEIESILRGIKFRDYRVSVWTGMPSEVGISVASAFKSRDLDSIDLDLDTVRAARYSYLEAFEAEDRFGGVNNYLMPNRRVIQDPAPQVASGQALPQGMRIVRDVLAFTLGLIHQVEFHEMRENFYFRNQRVFDPHTTDRFPKEPMALDLVFGHTASPVV